MWYACQATDHQVDHGHANHGVARLGHILVVLRASAVAAAPPAGPLHHPPLREELEAFRALGPLDHVQADLPPGPQGPHPGDEVPTIGLIGPEQPKAHARMPAQVQPWQGPLTVWHAGRRHHHPQPEASRIDEEMALAPVDMFGFIIPVVPPFAVVLTDWLSMIPALGWRCRPAATRTSPRRRSWMSCQVPSCRQRQQSWSTLSQGGRSWGSRRQAPPRRRTDKRPWRISRVGYVARRPRDLAWGIEGSSTVHS
jgi:hypothetical protein